MPLFCIMALLHKLFHRYSSVGDGWRLRHMMKSPCCVSLEPYFFWRDCVCVLQQRAVIFIRCNSVGSPAVWRGNVSLPLAQDIHHLVTATQGSSSLPGGGGSRLSLSYWTAGHEDDWWTAVAHSHSPIPPFPPWHSLFYLQAETRRNDLTKVQGRIWTEPWVKWRVALIRSRRLLGTKAQRWCSEMSCLTLWWYEVLVFQGCWGGSHDCSTDFFFGLHPW